MKLRAIVEFEEDFIDFVKKETGIKTKEGLKAYFMGIYAREDMSGIKKIDIEVEDETD